MTDENQAIDEQVTESAATEPTALEAFEAAIVSTEEAPEAVTDDPITDDEPAAEEAAPVEEEAEPVAEETAPVAEEAAPAEPLDPIEQEINDLGLRNKKSADRFRALANETRDLKLRTAQLEEEARKGQELYEHITATGATAEQYGQAMFAIEAANSNDPAKLAAFYELLQHQLKFVGEKIGRAAPGYDPVTQHADLREEIEGGLMAREKAEELAALRAAEQMRQQQYQAQQQRLQAQQAAEHERNSAIAALNSRGAQLAATDPHYAAKAEYVMGRIAPALQNAAPSQWQQMFDLAYSLAPDPQPVAPAPVAAPRPRVGAVPVRPTGGAGVTRNPTSALDAFMSGVESAGR